mgnify:CR=1 FL=1
MRVAVGQHQHGGAQAHAEAGRRRMAAVADQVLGAFLKGLVQSEARIALIEVTQLRGATCKMHGIARVDGDIAAEADMGAMVRDK